MSTLSKKRGSTALPPISVIDRPNQNKSLEQPHKSQS